MIITIDGPAGAGKSTVAKLLSKRLKIGYLDTGALYRAVTLMGLRQNLDFENENAWVAMAKDAKIEQNDLNGALQVLLNSEDISEAIRSEEVTDSVRYVAQMLRIRALMVDLQRELGKKNDIVGEGRDLGTVVFPHADFKFYLDADPQERLQRRAREMQDKGEVVDVNDLEESMTERDLMDQSREVSPLKAAEDSIIIDSTGFNPEEVVDQLENYIKNG